MTTATATAAASTVAFRPAGARPAHRPALRPAAARPSLARRNVRQVARPARLTRRGRLVVVLGVLVAAVLGLSVVAGSSQASRTSPHPVRHTVTVQPGETLWQVSARVAPHADPRLIVAEIEQANHLAGPQVFGGQQLLVPASR
jgi:Tfp pilus assembly protein FimV